MQSLVGVGVGISAIVDVSWFLVAFGNFFDNDLDTATSARVQDDCSIKLIASMLLS